MKQSHVAADVRNVRSGQQRPRMEPVTCLFKYYVASWTLLAAEEKAGIDFTRP